MKLIKRNESNWLMPEVDNFFGDFFANSFSFRLPSIFGEQQGFTPSIDVAETDKTIVVKAELPGLNEKDIEVTLDDGVLTIKGEKKQEIQTNKDTDKDGVSYYRMERNYGSFSRSIELPSYAETEKVKASHKDGVLTIEIPKNETSPKGKRIEIENN